MRVADFPVQASLLLSLQGGLAHSQGQKGARAMLFVALAFLGLVPIRLAILVVAAVLHPDTYQ